MTVATPDLALDHVGYTYPGGLRALRGITLHIAPGSRVAIIGQNGAGKSTLLRHLNGLLRPIEGRVLFDGADVVRRPVETLAVQVGFAFQNPDLQLFAETVGEEVAFGPRNLGLDGPQLESAVTAALKAVGLESARDANPFNLGFSRRKLVALASVLAMRTPILVLDEPTSGQDGPGMARLERVVAEAADAGRTVIAASHDMRFVAESFSRILILRAGMLVADGPPESVFGPAARPLLRSTHLEPPPAACVGATFALGSTPTEEALRRALRAARRAGAPARAALDPPSGSSAEPTDAPNGDGRASR